MREATPKKDWGPGPWQREPDELRWTDKATGLRCIIVRNMDVTGSLCGYVGVEPTHPAYELAYSGETGSEAREHHEAFRAALRRNAHKPILERIEDLPPRPEPVPGIGDLVNNLTAHGGLSYAGRLKTRVNDDLWWFGFDCSHAWDISPGIDATLRSLGATAMSDGIPGMVYRDIKYVKKECADLARQLKAIEDQAKALVLGAARKEGHHDDQDHNGGTDDGKR